MAFCVGGLLSDAPWWVSRVATVLSIVSPILLIVHMWQINRAAKGLIPLIILLSVLFVYLTQSLIIPALLISLLYVVGEGSMLIAVVNRKQAQWLPLIPILAFAVTIAVCRDPRVALVSLIPFPAMLALGFGTRSSAASDKGLTRVGVICATTFALGLSVIAVAAAFFYHWHGSLSPATLNEALEGLRATLISTITSMELPIEATEEMAEFFSLENATYLVNSAINILPGTVVMVILMFAAAAQLMQHAALQTFLPKDTLSDRVRIFTMSIVSCVVFAVAYLVAIFSGNEASTLAGTVAQNIYLILLPGLSLAGLLRIASSIVRRGAGGGMGCMFFLILIIPCLLLVTPVVLALTEVIGNIASAITSRTRSSGDGGSGQTPPSAS